MTDVIKTNAGIGAPAYVDDNAPDGGQFLTGNPPVHTKIPEFTKVQKTGKVNTAKPTPFCEIKVQNGLYANKIVWVKTTHIETVTDPVVPPVSGRRKFKIISKHQDSTGEYVEVEEVV